MKFFIKFLLAFLFGVVLALACTDVFAQSFFSGNYVRKSGDTMSGSLNFSTPAGAHIKGGNPSGNLHIDPLPGGILYLNYYSGNSNGQVIIGNGAGAASGTIWHAGNDGAGSSLDADLLDGQHGAYYLPAASYTAADVLSKTLTVDGDTSGLDADLWKGKTVRRGQASLDFGSVAGHDTATLTMTVTGVNIPDVCSVSPPLSYTPGGGILMYTAVRSASNTVNVYATNVTTTAYDPAAITFSIICFAY